LVPAFEDLRRPRFLLDKRRWSGLRRRPAVLLLSYRAAIAPAPGM